MKMVIVSQAKSRSSSYIRSAQEGEQVVIMRGSKPAVILHPVTEGDLNVVPEISALSAGRMENEIERERKARKLVKLGNSTEEAVAALRRLSKSRR